MAGVIGKSVVYWDSWNFVIEVDGVPVAGFNKCSGVGFTIAVSQFMEGGVNGISSQSHGPEKPKDVTFEQGESGDGYFWDWRKAIKAGAVDDLRTFTVAQKHGSKVVERLPLINCAMSDFDAGEFDRGSEDKKRIRKIVLKPTDIEREAV